VHIVLHVLPRSLMLASHLLTRAGRRTQSPDCALRIPVSHDRRRACLFFLLVHQAFGAWCRTLLLLTTDPRSPTTKLICSICHFGTAALSALMMLLRCSFASASFTSKNPSSLSVDCLNSTINTICSASLIATPFGGLTQKQFSKKDPGMSLHHASCETGLVLSTYQRRRQGVHALMQYSLWAIIANTASPVSNTQLPCTQQAKSMLCPGLRETPLFIVGPSNSEFECRRDEGFFERNTGGKRQCLECEKDAFCPMHTNLQFQCPPNSRGILPIASHDMRVERGLQGLLGLSTEDAYCRADPGYVLQHAHIDISALVMATLTFDTVDFYTTAPRACAVRIHRLGTQFSHGVCPWRISAQRRRRTFIVHNMSCEFILHRRSASTVPATTVHLWHWPFLRHRLPVQSWLIPQQSHRYYCDRLCCDI